MKRSYLSAFLILFIVLLCMAVPVNADTSTLTQVSPLVGYTGNTVTVNVTGTFTNTVPSEVRLMMSGKTNITSLEITGSDNTSVLARIQISSSATVGTWYLVVYNEDGSESSNRLQFKIRAPIALTSITPASARTNNDSVDVTLVGTGLSGVSSMYLYNADYTNISAVSVNAPSDTKVTGTFDLTDKDTDTYKVCVKDSFGTVKCGLTFEILSDAVGSMDVSSTPSGASIYVDNTYKGTTPATVTDLDTGSHKLLLKKSGYVDWAKMVKITAGSTATVDADLEAVTTAPTAVPTTVPTSAPTTVKTTRKSTITTPTPWPSATETPSSPVGPLAIIGGIALAFLVIRRR